ncbi:DUF6314 family protein [Patulibacter americanus]|uniref:DUF6314 family protein n=1 Tax=Patulibacter americanus TaxID=588672 RepID=UPI0003B5C166|nr:DUF6314 family protein [Patulibacter americanus]
MAVPTPTIAVDDPRAFLPGTWQIDREVHDALAGTDGRYVGTATFALDGDGLSWVERGTLQLGGFEGTATRTMAVVPGPDGAEGRWEVRFDDGRPFHPLDLRAGACPVDHPCGEDHYAGWVRVEGPGLLVVSWRVTGPRKDHTILTRYTR